MPVAIITGTGTHSLPGFSASRAEPRRTPYGTVEVTRGTFADADVLHVSRHGPGHVRMSNLVAHRANIWALSELGADAVIACTACGAVDPTLQLGSLVVFDDLHFPSNRLPDGTLCTFHDHVGDPLRGHWILHGGPFSSEVRAALVHGAAKAGHAARDGGVYGHVDGPRFNTRAEIRSLQAVGVTAVSQTAGPETVLCGEAGIPYALLGFVTDYANGVAEEATPVETLMRLLGESGAVLASTLEAAAARIEPGALPPAGTQIAWE